jgi:roadblock/LC7 domain-containing protein
MTTRRTRKVVVYYCDFPECKAKHVAPFVNFKQAWPDAKAAGWIAATVGDRWFHFCMWVHRPSDLELQKLAGEQASKPSVRAAFETSLK